MPVTMQVQHRIKGIKAIKSGAAKHNHDKNYCWICAGWEERTFCWDPQTSGPISTGPIYIHFDFD